MATAGKNQRHGDSEHIKYAAVVVEKFTLFWFHK
jgi:hypothetical protein